MNISSAELELIARAKLRRRMMRLLVYPHKPCPLTEGRCYKLRSGKRKPIEVTVTAIRRESLSELSLRDARAEGYETVDQAIQAFHDRCGTGWLSESGAMTDPKVWVISFVRGDETGFVRDAPLLLARRGDYTTEPARAIPNEPEVLLPLPEDLARARAKAEDDRLAPQRAALDRMKADSEKLLTSMTAMKQRNRLKLITRTLDKVLDDLPGDRGATIP